MPQGRGDVAVIDADASRRDGRHHTGHPVGSRPGVELLGRADELELIEAKNTQASNRMKLKVLKEYSYPSDLADKKSKLVQAEQALERVKKKNASNLAKVIADEKAAEQTLVTTLQGSVGSRPSHCAIAALPAALVVVALAAPHSPKLPVASAPQERSNETRSSQLPARPAMRSHWARAARSAASRDGWLKA